MSWVEDEDKLMLKSNPGSRGFLSHREHLTAQTLP